MGCVGDRANERGDGGGGTLRSDTDAKADRRVKDARRRPIIIIARTVWWRSGGVYACKLFACGVPAVHAIGVAKPWRIILGRRGTAAPLPVRLVRRDELPVFVRLEIERVEARPDPPLRLYLGEFVRPRPNSNSRATLLRARLVTVFLSHQSLSLLVQRVAGRLAVRGPAKRPSRMVDTGVFQTVC
jgi:hypothetical protein